MKIGFLIYSLGGGGTERILTELCNEFIVQGHEIRVFLYDNKNIAYPIHPNVRIINCSGENPRENKGYLVRLIKLRRLIKAEKPQILFAFSVSMIGLARLSTLGIKMKIVGSERANPYCHSIKNKCIIRFLTPLCDGMVFQTSGAQRYYPRSVREKSTIIPNPVSEMEIKSPVLNKPIQDFCSVGRLHTDKDFKTLINAFKKLSSIYRTCSLTIFGDGILKEELEKYVNGLGLSEKIIFAGFDKNLLLTLKKYDAFVFSSRAEGMPNALMEAMSIGLPCISTDCQFGPNELIKNGQNGFLVPVGDENILANKMCWLIENPEKAYQIGRRASDIQRTHSKRIIFKMYLDYLETVVNS